MIKLNNNVISSNNNSSINLNKGLRNPKPHILGAESMEIRSSKGKRFKRRLNEDTNLNLGKALKELSDEKRELLSLGQNKLTGGSMTAMKTFTLKRFSTVIPSLSSSISIPRKYTLKRFSSSSSPVILKTYVLRRKTFGAIDGTVGHITDFAGKTINSTVGTVENVAGGAATGVGKAADSFVGKNIVGTTVGGLAGMALAPKLGMMLGGPLGALAGGLLAPTVGLVGGSLLGRSIMSGGGKLLKGVGEGLQNDAASRTA